MAFSIEIFEYNMIVFRDKNQLEARINYVCGVLEISI